MQRCHKDNFIVACLPHTLVHRESDNAVLDSTNAGREGLIVSIYGKALLVSVKVSLNPLDILAGPLISLAVADVVVILKAS